MTNYNHSTRITTSTFGILLGTAGILNHGIFEILQGDTPTNGFFIEAIGKSHRFWVYGTEEAFTIIPNFMITGILVIVISIAVILWSVRFIHLRHGSAVFLLLLILLTLVGGGIGYIILFLPVWAYSTRINKPLSWWEKVFKDRPGKLLSALWPYVLALSAFLWIIVMELGIFGYCPGQTDPDTLLTTVFIFLISTVVLANAAFICAFARDIETQVSR